MILESLIKVHHWHWEVWHSERVRNDKIVEQRITTRQRKERRAVIEAWREFPTREERAKWIITMEDGWRGFEILSKVVKERERVISRGEDIRQHLPIHIPTQVSFWKKKAKNMKAKCKKFINKHQEVVGSTMWKQKALYGGVVSGVAKLSTIAKL